ncbi:MAG: hypothetical protein ACYC23_12120 [Limisphaerales bacterium]
MRSPSEVGHSSSHGNELGALDGYRKTNGKLRFLLNSKENSLFVGSE